MCLLISEGLPAQGPMDDESQAAESDLDSSAAIAAGDADSVLEERLRSRAQASFHRVCPGAQPTWAAQSTHVTSR